MQVNCTVTPSATDPGQIGRRALPHDDAAGALAPKGVFDVRDIAVLCPGYRGWHGSVRYAAQLAASLHAALTGLFVAPRHATVPAPSRLLAEMAAYVQDDLQQAMLAGRDFAAWAGPLGAGDTCWRVAIGAPTDALAQLADWHDAVVLALPRPGLGAERRIGAVLRAGAACIAVPDGNVAPGCVVHATVAWDGSAAATRALHTALPLLRTARTVSLLQRDDAHADALSHLRAHEVRVDAVETMAATGDATDQILSYATDTRADLIVTGAPGGHALRGLDTHTSHLLARSRLPVLMKS